MTYFESFMYLKNRGWKTSELDEMTLRQVKGLAARVENGEVKSKKR